MKKIFIAILVLLVFAVSACKKKRSSQNSPLVQNPTTVAPGEPAISGIPSSTDSIYGFLRVEKLYAGATPPPGYTVFFQLSASFFVNSIPLRSAFRMFSLTKNKVQAVSVDDRTLIYGDYEYGYIYNDQNQTLNLNQVVWDVKDTSGIPTFRRKVTRGMPALKNTSFFPNSISKSHDLRINFEEFVSNADSVFVMINDMKGFSMMKGAAYSLGSINFTSAELSAADETTTGAGMYVWADNYSHSVINGRTIVFFMRTSIGSGLIDIQP